MLLIFDVSGGELLVIMIFVLLFFGSKGIPGIARTLGRTMRQIRDASAEVQREIERGTQEVKKGFDDQKRAFTLDQPQPSAPTAQVPPTPTVPVEPTEVPPVPGGPGA